MNNNIRWRVFFVFGRCICRSHTPSRKSIMTHKSNPQTPYCSCYNAAHTHLEAE